MDLALILWWVPSPKTTAHTAPVRTARVASVAQPQPTNTDRKALPTVDLLADSAVAGLEGRWVLAVRVNPKSQPVQMVPVSEGQSDLGQDQGRCHFAEQRLHL